jgi:hypothetical protein
MDVIWRRWLEERGGAVLTLYRKYPKAQIRIDELTLTFVRSGVSKR